MHPPLLCGLIVGKHRGQYIVGLNRYATAILPTWPSAIGDLRTGTVDSTAFSRKPEFYRIWVEDLPRLIGVNEELCTPNRLENRI